MLASVVWGSLTLQFAIELRHERRNPSCQADGIELFVGMADSETTEIRFAWFDKVQRFRSRPAGTRHAPDGASAIVRWMSSESVRAPTFLMALARWVSTVLWLMFRT